MPQYQDFGFQPPPRLQASHNTRTNRKAIAPMRRSCSDSLLTASQLDGVFGSDRTLLSEVDDTSILRKRPAVRHHCSLKCSPCSQKSRPPQRAIAAAI